MYTVFCVRKKGNEKCTYMERMSQETTQRIDLKLQEEDLRKVPALQTRHKVSLEQEVQTHVT